MAKLKRYLSGILASFVTAASLLHTAGSVMAMESAQMAYVKDVLGKYLSDTDYASMNGVSISEAIDLYDLETMQVCNKDIFIAYYNDTVIGTMCVSLYEGNYYSTFQEYAPECLQAAYDADKEIAYCCLDGESLIFDGENFYNIQEDSMTEYSFENEDAIQLRSMKGVYGQLQEYSVSKARSVVISESLNSFFQPVRNTIIDGNGACWACSIATKYNYEHGYLEGDEGYINAVRVYATVRGSFESGLVRPIGNIQYTTLGLRLHGQYDTYCQTPISATAIYYELINNNPVIIAVEDVDSDGTHARHSLAIGGIEYNDNDTAIYTIADSNISTLTEAHVTSNADSDSGEFVYVTENYTYTNWYCTYSYSPDNPYIGS